MISSSSSAMMDESSSPDETSSDDDLNDGLLGNNKKRKRVTKHQSRRAKPLTVDILWQIFEKLGIHKDPATGTYKLVLPNLKSADCSAMYFAVTEWQCFRKRIMNHGFEIIDEQPSLWIRVRPNLATPDGILVFEDAELRRRYGTPCKIKNARERNEIFELPAAETEEVLGVSQEGDACYVAEMTSESNGEPLDIEDRTQTASPVPTSTSVSGVSSPSLSSRTDSNATSSAISIVSNGQQMGSNRRQGQRSGSVSSLSSSFNSACSSSPSTVCFSPTSSVFNNGGSFGLASSLFSSPAARPSLPSFSSLFSSESDQTTSQPQQSQQPQPSSSSMDVDSEVQLEGALRNLLPLPLVARELLVSGHYSLSNGQFDIQVTMKGNSHPFGAPQSPNSASFQISPRPAQSLFPTFSALSPKSESTSAAKFPVA